MSIVNKLIMTKFKLKKVVNNKLLGLLPNGLLNYQMIELFT